VKPCTGAEARVQLPLLQKVPAGFLVEMCTLALYRISIREAMARALIKIQSQPGKIV